MIDWQAKLDHECDVFGAAATVYLIERSVAAALHGRYTERMPTIVIATTERAILEERLADSQSAVLYTAIPDLDADDVPAEGTVLLEVDQAPLHIEFDQVRQLWAVRKATTEEVAEERAELEAVEEHAEAEERAETAERAEARERAEAHEQAEAQRRARVAEERAESEERIEPVRARRT
jgi:hypothetical protein